MSTYEESGVNISEGDKASRIAYTAAKATFAGREGMIGSAVVQDGGFAGLVDMGDFYLVQNDDGIGSKEVIAEAIGKYDTLGYDLLAMVIDDAACVGAEVITCSNTMDVKKVISEKVEKLMEGFKNACLAHKVIIPGGEIAELNTMVNNNLWNATSVGIVEKHKVITGAKVKAGDKVIALRSDGFRSNGFSLVRHVLENAFGDDCYMHPYDEDISDAGHRPILENHTIEKSWGAKVLTPSKIYYSFIMDLHGRFKEPAKVDIHGIVHVTGGGITANLQRILKNGLGAHLDNLFPPHEMMSRLQTLGDISDEEAYKVWNMGNGMFIIVDESDVPLVLERAQANNIEAQVAGTINASGMVTL
ncbi:MAG: AIR synthase-related protein [Candidatus Peregrinibacteria bacterium]|nr:AIR synthase-related protein [Candidatus Peregrinibacteria bacterium]MDZ4244704.1 AIR synthase-related protein [Candidatus Gracilibacteria bacterium]